MPDENGNRARHEGLDRRVILVEDALREYIKETRDWRHQTYANQYTVLMAKIAANDAVLMAKITAIEIRMAQKSGAGHVLMILGSVALSLAAMAISWFKH